MPARLAAEPGRHESGEGFCHPGSLSHPKKTSSPRGGIAERAVDTVGRFCPTTPMATTPNHLPTLPRSVPRCAKCNQWLADNPPKTLSRPRAIEEAKAALGSARLLESMLPGSDVLAPEPLRLALVALENAVIGLSGVAGVLESNYGGSTR